MKTPTAIVMSFAFFALSNLNGQSDSIPLGKVIYARNICIPGSNSAYMNGSTSLLFNRTNSVFIHNAVPENDSSYTDSQYIFEVKAYGDSEGFPIYRKHGQPWLITKFPCKESKVHCIVSDTVNDMNWKLHPEFRIIGQFNCQKAVCQFRGRSYVAWYTLEIPISSGPYKFGGLPGLILDVESTDGLVKFNFVSLEISSSLTDVIRPPSGIYLSLSLQAYYREESLFFKNLIDEAKAKGVGMTIERNADIELISPD
ncbi:MAG: GLPGLI family protein [Saprospiraceae bacterium]